MDYASIARYAEMTIDELFAARNCYPSKWMSGYKAADWWINRRSFACTQILRLAEDLSEQGLVVISTRPEGAAYEGFRQALYDYYAELVIDKGAWDVFMAAIPAPPALETGNG